MPEDDLPLLTFVDTESLERWLNEQGEASPGAWLRFAKQGAPEATLSKSAEFSDRGRQFRWMVGADFS